MKRIVLIAALAALPCMSALTYAQAGEPAAAPASKTAVAPSPKPAAVPAAKPAQTPAAAAASPAAAPSPVVRVAKPASRKGGHSRATRDARHCLQLASNTEIIKCAEKYR